jgi:hypothetical protein
MRYEGKKETLTEIETEIRNNSMSFERKPKTYDNLFGVESVVKTIVLDVLIPNEAYLFPVRFLYDNRPNSLSVIDVRDKDMWWLLRVAPAIIKLMGDMAPQQNEKADLLKGKVVNMRKEAQA